MAKLIAAIDTSTIDPTQGGAGGFPVGQHKVVAIKSEVKATAKGDGGMVTYECQVIEGPAQGTIGAIRFNLYNQNQQAVDIALRQFSAFAHSVGKVGQIFDTDELLNIPFQIEVGLQRGEEQAKKGYTEVKRFFDYNGNEPGQNGGGQQQGSNNGFGGGQQQPQNNGGQQGIQQGGSGGFPVGNGVQMPQNNQQQPQQNAPAGGWNGAGAGGGQQTTNAPAGNGATWGAGANGGGNAAPGGWGQQRA